MGNRLCRTVPIGEDLGRTRVFWLWVVYSVALLAASFIPGNSVPSLALLGWDKLAHAVAFALLAALSLGVLARSRRWLWWTFGYGAVIGALTEWFQSFTPGRTMSLYDWIADAVGTLVVMAAAAVWLRGRTRREEEERSPRLKVEAAAPIREA